MIWNIYFGDVKILQYLLTYSHLYLSNKKDPHLLFFFKDFAPYPLLFHLLVYYLQIPQEYTVGLWCQGIPQKVFASFDIKMMVKSNGIEKKNPTSPTSEISSYLTGPTLL